VTAVVVADPCAPGPAAAPDAVRRRRIRPPKPSLALVADLLAVLVLLLFTAAYATKAIESVTPFTGPYADGAFQLYDPIRRIAFGQVPGRDFTFFHGILVPYLHYPLFLLFGGRLYGSELARHTLSPVAFLITAFVMSRVLLTRTRTALWLTAAFVAVSPILQLPALLADPSNSLLGVRSAVPMLATAALAVAARRGGRRWLLVGLLAGIGLLSGTEQGIAFLCAAGVAVLLVGRGRMLRRFALAAGLGAVALVTALVILLLVTRGSVSATVALVRYALVDVPGDQFWYFGGPPVRFVTSVQSMFVTPYLGLVLLFIATIAMATVWAMRSGRLQRWAAMTALVLSVYAGISFTAYFGIASSNYLTPGLRACCFAVLFLLLGRTTLRRAARRAPVVRPPAQISAALLCCVAVTGAVGLVADDSPQKAADLPGAIARLGTDGRGLSWPWRSYLKSTAVAGDHQCTGQQDPWLWATYASLMSTRRGCFNQDTDYIIHALGPAGRQRYLDTFRATRPEIVETMRRDGFPFEDWLRTTSWAFYRDVYTGYTPIAITNHSVLWRRRTTAAEPGIVWGPEQVTAPGPDGIVLAPHPGCDIIDASVSYRATDALAGVPIAGSVNRHLLSIRNSDGSASLAVNPRLPGMSMPLLPTSRADPITLTASASKLIPGSRTTLTGVTWRCGVLPAATLWQRAVRGDDPDRLLPRRSG
jgi:hypothetical protein